MSHPGTEHAGTLACGRTAASLAVFHNSRAACTCWTCHEHARVVGGVRVCGGCAVEEKKKP